MVQKVGQADYTQVMGILNATPDSFSDGGCYMTVEDAVARAQEIDKAGADIIDVGGESTRPGAEPVPIHEELKRVIPVIDQIDNDPEIEASISVDTYKPDVAEAALDVGADVINDQNGLDDPEMRSLVAAQECSVVLMDAVNLPVDPKYSSDTEEIVVEVRDRLEDKVKRAIADGISSDQLILDPGIGFATGDGEDIELIARTNEIVELGFPVLIGASRKSFTTELMDLPPSNRLAPSLAAHLVAAENGADVVRVHDVAETVHALRTAEAMWEHRTQS